MKVRAVAGLIAISLILGGCGSLAGRHNIDSGFSYIENYDYNSALESFAAAEENGEDACLIHRGKGIICLNTGDYQGAVDELLASLAADEGIVDDMDFDTNYYLAEAYSKLGEYNKAKEVYDAILALRSKDSTAYYLRGTAELASGNHDSAYTDFAKAITLNPRDYSMIILIYKSLAEYGYEDEAVSILQTAMNNGSQFMSNYEKGQISYYLGNYRDATEFLRTASNERDQEKEPVVLLLGKTWETLGEYPSAISEYKSYLKESPDSARIYNQLGICLLGQGKNSNKQETKQELFDEAIRAFEAGKAIDDKEVNQAIRLNMITAYEYLGDFTTAQSLMSDYLRDYPDDSAANRENVFLSTR